MARKNHMSFMGVAWNEIFWLRVLLIAWSSNIAVSGITSDSVWIGGTNYGSGTISKDYYWYPTAEEFNFTNWDTDQPDSREWKSLNPSEGPEIEHCVYMRNFVDAKYKWADGLCSEPLLVLCDDSCDRVFKCTSDYICGDNHQPGTSSKRDKVGEMGECQEAKWAFDHTLDAGSCNCLENVSKIKPEDEYIRFPPLRLNWWEARNWCLKYNLTMAVIYSKEDQLKIQRTIKLTRDHVWVSGTDWGQHGFWYWANTGQILTKFDGASEPFRRFWKLQNGTEVVEHCLYLDVKNKYNWLDGDCFLKKYFVCESSCGDIHKCYCDDHSKIPEF